MKNPRQITILIVAVIALLGVLYLLVGPGKKTSEESAPAPTAEDELHLKAVETKRGLTQTDKVSGDLILEKNDDFEVRYLISNDQFIILVPDGNFGEIKVKALGWFEEKGFDKKDFCFLRISFAPGKDVTGMENQTLLPEGCPTPTPLTPSS